MREYIIRYAVRIRAESEEEAKQLANQYAPNATGDHFADADDEKSAGILRVDRSDPAIVGFSKGDFIWWNAGMGDADFGTVKKMPDDSTVQVSRASNNRTFDVPMTDVYGLTTRTEYDEYLRVRAPRDDVPETPKE